MQLNTISPSYIGTMSGLWTCGVVLFLCVGYEIKTGENQYDKPKWNWHRVLVSAAHVFSPFPLFTS